MKQLFLFLLAMCAAITAFSQHTNYNIGPVSIECAFDKEELNFNFKNGIFIKERFTGVYITSASERPSKMYFPLMMEAHGDVIFLRGSRGSSARFSIKKLLNYDTPEQLFDSLMVCLFQGSGGSGGVDADNVAATPHGNITGTTVQAQLEQLVASTDFGRVWYCSKNSGNNATGEVGNYFAPFRDPWFLNDSLQPYDLVVILDGQYRVTLNSSSAVYDNPIAGVNPELGRSNVTYYWNPGTGITHVGSCLFNTAFFRTGHRSNLGFTNIDYPEGVDAYRLNVLGYGAFKNGTMYMHSIKGNSFLPGDTVAYPQHYVYLQADTVQHTGAAIEIYGGSIELTADINVGDMKDVCTGGGRGVVHFGSFGSQSSFYVDSLTVNANFNTLKVGRSGVGNTSYPVFGNSGSGGASKKFSRHNLAANIGNLIVDSVALRGVLVQYASGTVADNMNISVKVDNANIQPSSTASLINIDGQISGSITIDMNNAKVGCLLYEDNGGSTSAESLNIGVFGNYTLDDAGFEFTGNGRTNGRKIIAGGNFRCSKQLLYSNRTEAQNPSEFYFTGLAIGGTDTLFESSKDVYYFGKSISTLPLFKSTVGATVYTSNSPNEQDYQGAVNVELGRIWYSDEFTATAAQVDFVASEGRLPVDGANVRVYDDSGAKLRENDHYTYVAATGTVTLVTPAIAGEKYTIEYYQ